MAFQTEDGTGLPGANSFLSEADATALVESMGLAGWPADQQERQQALVRASSWLSSYYRWKGSKVKGRDQGLAWPRSGAMDNEGNEVGSEEVPREVQLATLFAAIAEAGAPGALTPTITPNQMAVMEKVGLLTIQYRSGKRSPQDMSGVDDGRPVLSAIYDQIKGLITKPDFVGVTVA